MDFILTANIQSSDAWVGGSMQTLCIFEMNLKDNSTVWTDEEPRISEITTRLVFERIRLALVLIGFLSTSFILVRTQCP